jgi:hypothetical protein
MLINLKCDTCKEPSKYVTGFYDGKKGKHGVLYDCKNELRFGGSIENDRTRKSNT